MVLIVLCIIFLATTTTTVEANWLTDRLKYAAIGSLGFDTSSTCGFTRDNALACFKQYVDLNHDGEIEAVEFEHAKQAYMPPRMREAMKLAKSIGFDFTVKDVLDGCDANKDGHLTIQDFHDAAKTCLPGASDLCMLSTVCKIAAEKKY